MFVIVWYTAEGKAYLTEIDPDGYAIRSLDKNDAKQFSDFDDAREFTVKYDFLWARVENV